MIGLLVLYSCIDTQLLPTAHIHNKRKSIKTFFSREFAIMIAINAFYLLHTRFANTSENLQIAKFLGEFNVPHKIHSKQQCSKLFRKILPVHTYKHAKKTGK